MTTEGVPMRKGIDVASFQHPHDHPIDWPKVHDAGYTWAAVKVDESTHDFYVNPYAARDIAAATSAGVEVVLYSFGRPSSQPPAAAAAHFVAAIPAGFEHLRRCLDLEVDEGIGWAAVTQWARDFCRLAQATLLYVNRNYWHGVQSAGGVPGVGIWLAWPGASGVPDGCEIVQNGQGNVPGIEGLVDINQLADSAGAGGATSPPDSHGAPSGGDLPLLKQGASGDDVRARQHDLNRWGAHLIEDGVFGPMTDTVLRQFQGAHGLTADGIIGPLTRAKLATEPPPAPGPVVAPPAAPTFDPGAMPMIQSGSNGHAVAVAQQHLNMHGANLVVDGVFGPMTANQTRNFQRAHGLVDDGIIGPKTWAKLAEVDRR